MVLIENSGNEALKRMYRNHGNKVEKVTQVKDGGAFSRAKKTIKWDVVQPNRIDKGMHKFSTLAHEYGHAFDNLAEFEGLTYNELDLISERLGFDRNLRGPFRWVPSSSDKFLSALRKDKEGLREKLEELQSVVVTGDLSTSWVQDTASGFWGAEKACVRFGHPEPYWNRRYNSVVAHRNDPMNSVKKKKLKEAYQELGLDASAKQHFRIYDTASETWANMTAAITTGGEQLEQVKKYLPNSYQAYLEIIKEVK